MKNNNKGFSLVELIVVIAIMAVLVGVLAPSLLRYVEKSRAQKDESAMSEVTNAIQLAIADEEVYDEVAPATGTTVTFTFTPNSDGKITISAGIADDSYPDLLDEVEGSVGTEIQLNSKAHKSDTYTVTVTYGDNDNVKVSGSFPS